MTMAGVGKQTFLKRKAFERVVFYFVGVSHSKLLGWMLMVYWNTQHWFTGGHNNPQHRAEKRTQQHRCWLLNRPSLVIHSLSLVILKHTITH